MSESELQVIAEQNNLSHTKIQELLSQFGDSFAQAQELSKSATGIVVTDEAQTKEMADARSARLKLKNIRVEVEHTRKQLKEESLREGKAIDGMANIIKALIVPVEEHLERQEKFAEVKQAERLATRLAERVEKLAPYVDDVSVYSLRDLDDAAFDVLLAQAIEAKQAKDKAEADAEAARRQAAKEADEEQARIRAENERLRKEAEAREAELAEERRKLKEKEDAEEARAKEAAEAEAAAQTAARQELVAPDRDKLLRFADQHVAIVPPSVSDPSAVTALEEARVGIARITANLRKKASEL
jgi:hypothetical protein